ncbi:hypothetical protein TELCIR_04989 [Teladorsagia circumcincta]|uniref:AMP-dependent synthetase/ligase domain-containing protein n=1 Tax=Teladorsagia circumcincta TaxID=45464 RepID=A0A2G9US26_TELCI|nr:hypothetical protein TELCIR_04989 [Teladorsagia circumcincta]
MKNLQGSVWEMSVSSDLLLLGFPSKHTSFTRAFLDYTSSYGEKVALIDPYTEEKLTFSEVQLAVESIRQRLTGISKGTVIASICGNSISVLLTYVAAIDLGTIIVPVNPASKQYEIEKYLEECQVEKVLTEKEYATKINDILAQPKFEEISTIVLEDLRIREPVMLDATVEPSEEDTVRDILIEFLW